MTSIDTRFLTVHPSTAAWWARRDKCRACAHYMPSIEHQKDRGGERCGALMMPNAVRTGRSIAAYCVDARSEGARCGPGAAMFTPKKGKR